MESYDYGITDRPLGEGIAWGLVEEHSPIKPDSVLVVEALTPGHRVNAFHLEALAKAYGIPLADDVDGKCKPCAVCGLAFFDPYNYGICNVCESLHTADGPEAYDENH